MATVGVKGLIYQSMFHDSGWYWLKFLIRLIAKN